MKTTSRVVDVDNSKPGKQIRQTKKYKEKRTKQVLKRIGNRTLRKEQNLKILKKTTQKTDAKERGTEQKSKTKAKSNTGLPQKKGACHS